MLRWSLFHKKISWINGFENFELQWPIRLLVTLLPSLRIWKIQSLIGANWTASRRICFARLIWKYRNASNTISRLHNNIKRIYIKRIYGMYISIFSFYIVVYIYIYTRCFGNCGTSGKEISSHVKISRKYRIKLFRTELYLKRENKIWILFSIKRLISYKRSKKWRIWTHYHRFMHF